MFYNEGVDNVSVLWTSRLSNDYTEHTPSVSFKAAVNCEDDTVSAKDE